MGARFTLTSAVAMSAAAILAVTPADAKCRRMGFTVNDYGKDGPTSDAKQLLDKHIAGWAASQGIKKFTTGKKDVKCELFLDVGLFDEHTCTAYASVCWDEPGAPACTARCRRAGSGWRRQASRKACDWLHLQSHLPPKPLLKLLLPRPKRPQSQPNRLKPRRPRSSLYRQRSKPRRPRSQSLSRP